MVLYLTLRLSRHHISESYNILIILRISLDNSSIEATTLPLIGKYKQSDKEAKEINKTILVKTYHLKSFILIFSLPLRIYIHIKYISKFENSQLFILFNKV